MYARGILFGKMKYELGDHSIVHCPELGLIADVEFKTKGYFTGSYNAIGGTIKNETTGEILYELSGMWNGEMFIKNVLSGQRELLHDANKVKPTPPLVRPLEEQGERESQRLWNKTVQAVIARNHELATDEKTSIEEMQREEAAKRVQDGVDWHPRYFRAVRSKPGESEEGEERLDWILNKEMYEPQFTRNGALTNICSDGATPEEQAKQILSICPILINQNYHERMPIPPSRASRQSMESLRSNRSFQKQHHENDPISMSASQHLAGIPQEQDDLIDVSQDGGQQVIPEASFSGPAKSMTEPVPVTVAQFTDYSTSTPTPPNDASQAPLRPQPVLRPTDLHEAQTVDDGQAQKEMESQLAKTGVPAHQEQPSALKDFHNELKEVVPSIEAGVSVPEGKKQEVGLKPPTLDRGESESSSDFVDAKGDS